MSRDTREPRPTLPHGAAPSGDRRGTDPVPPNAPLPGLPRPAERSVGVLRISVGRVRRGSEREFVERVRAHVSTLLVASPGLRGFAGGYRREGGGERFALVSFWSSDRAGGRLDEADRGGDSFLAGAADIERTDDYDALSPADGGLVDFSGGVIRLGRTTLLASRLEAGYERLRRSGDELQRTRMLIAQYMGRQVRDGDDAILTASVWPSLAALEAFVGPRPTGSILFPEMSTYLGPVSIEHFHTIEFGFGPDAYVPPRRAIAVRFTAPGADEAIAAIRATLTLGERDLVVAPLGRTGNAATDDDVHEGEQVIVVIRVVPAERFEAERLVEDLGGELLTAVD